VVRLRVDIGIKVYNIDLSDNVTVTDMETSHATHNLAAALALDNMPMSALSDQTHQHAPVEMVPNFLELQTFTLPLSTVVGASSIDSGEGPDKQFECSECDKRFASKSSVGRHYRKRHAHKPCLFSNSLTGCDFRWGGPYDYRHHLKRQHDLGNETIKIILGKTVESRGRATILGRDLPLPPPLSLYMTD